MLCNSQLFPLLIKNFEIIPLNKHCLKYPLFFTNYEFNFYIRLLKQQFVIELLITAVTILGSMFL